MRYQLMKANTKKGKNIAYNDDGDEDLNMVSPATSGLGSAAGNN